MCGKESAKNNEFYQKWNIYTPIIKHNTFRTVIKLIEFIDKMLVDEKDLYLNYRKDRLLDENKRLQELIEMNNDELKNLE